MSRVEKFRSHDFKDKIFDTYIYIYDTIKILYFIFLLKTMGEILNFLVKPTKTTEILSQKDDKFKMITIAIILLIHVLTIVWNTYFWIMWWLFDTSYYIKLFFYSIVFSLIFVLIVWGIWKIFGWKAKYLDVLLVTMLAEITFIIFNIIIITISLTQSIWLMLMSTFIFILALIWFLLVWSKWLSKIEQFSETKVTFTVILSVVILYFWNSFLSLITWISIL